MKVLLLNGSPKKEGCTYTALKVIADRLEEQGVEAEIFHAAGKPVTGCTACGQCGNNGHRCVFDNDGVNEALEKLKEADALIVGSPVYYASPNGSIISFLDRLFYAGSMYAAYKPAAAIVSARRAGTTATLEVLNKYFSFAKMPLISSNYWNMVHGNCPEDVKKDEEGLQIMRTLADNMVWILKCIEAGEQAGIHKPEAEEKIYTNFIRS